MSRQQAIRPEEALFGSKTSAQVMLALSLLEEATISDLARAAGADPASVMRVVDRWEMAGLVECTRQGRNRLVRMASRLRFKDSLKELLTAILLTRPDLVDSSSQLRRRPRRKDKEL